jgi:DNA-binding SARP family transcriptional activator
MEFRILGPLDVRSGDTPIPLGGAKQRGLLAILLLNAGEVVSMDRLVDELWGEDPPATAVKTVQVFVSQLRKALGADRIVTRAPGYSLEIDSSELDLHRFGRLADEGRSALAAGDAETAAARLREALGLWTGPPLSDLVYERSVEVEAVRLAELRLAALEDRIEADLQSGRSTELVGELQGLVARHPLRERPRAQLMLALYRSGRQAEALDVYRDTRATLVEELGIEPGSELQALERAVLRHDPALELVTDAPQGAPRPGGLFVGRENELGGMLHGLELAAGGRGGLFLVGGEPGIGKTRLADELADRARDRKAGVLWGRCWEAGGAPAYWPWIQVTRTLVRDSEPEQLRDVLGQGAPYLAELLPELDELLPGLPGPPVRDPAGARFRLFDAASSLLRTAAEDAPLLLILDDLHAADESSLLMLRFVAGWMADSRLVVLGIYRDTETGPGHPLAAMMGDLEREPHTRRLSLAGLAPAEVGRFVELRTGRAPPDGVVTEIHDRTLGNPLFVGEIVRLFAADGDPERMEAAAVAGVPPGVRDVISRRLESLPDRSRAVLELASVLGREFDAETLELPGLVDGDPLVALDEAAAARFVTAAPGSPGRLRFSHALVRDALYEAIPPGRRLALHRRAGDALEARHRGQVEPYLAQLAWHFFRAASEAGVEKALRYGQLAARRAADQLAYEEAARLYRLSLDALERTGSRDDALLCELLLELGDVRSRAGDEAGAKRTFLRAAGVARAGALPERFARAALGYGGRSIWTVGRDDPRMLTLMEEAVELLPEEDSIARARLLARVAAGPLKAQGDSSRERRFDLSREALEMARRLDDRDVLAWALEGRKCAIWGPDTMEEHWSISEEIVRMAEEGGDLEELVEAHVCRLIKLLGRLELDDFPRAHARATQAAMDLKQPARRWLVATMGVSYALLVGRLAEAERQIGETFELGQEALPWNAGISRLLQLFVLRGFQGRVEEMEDELRSAAAANPLYPVIRAAHASLQAEIGNEPEARAAIDMLAADGFAGVPIDDEWMHVMAHLGDACATLGDAERCALVYERLEPYGHRAAEGPIEVSLGSAGRQLGKLASTLGREADAAHWFDLAADVNGRAGAAPWLAHTRYDHARSLMANGEPADGLLREAACIYRSLGMERWAARCEVTEPTSV